MDITLKNKANIFLAEMRVVSLKYLFYLLNDSRISVLFCFEHKEGTFYVIDLQKKIFCLISPHSTNEVNGQIDIMLIETSLRSGAYLILI